MSFSGETYSSFSSPASHRAADDEFIGGIIAAVQCLGRDTVRLERLHLVVHQTDERRDDHRRSFHRQRRNLIAQTLASARRHQHQTVVYPASLPG